ncbi:MAG TPA: CHAT domain-containing protein, partial [Cyanophyceae cyanobacterium]
AQNATLVEYSIVYETDISDSTIFDSLDRDESQLYIWVVKPNGQITFRSSNLQTLQQEDKTDLAGLVTVSRESIGVRGLGVTPRIEISQIQSVNQTQSLQKLHQLLIEPIADLLPTNPKEQVVFIPQGALFMVPFPALQDKTGNYLIEQHTLLTSPSIQSLYLTQKLKENLAIRKLELGQSNVLVVGNPTMPSISIEFDKLSQQLPPLPGAEREAKAIASLFNTEALTGDRATLPEVLEKLASARIIHLATHGLLLDAGIRNELWGEGSAIAFAPSPEYDGLLSTGTILSLDLNAELVVLSACNTGTGTITGDGVLALYRSFIAAGVPSVVVSLWSVPDAPTAELMVEFYHQLQQNPDKAQALREAMLATKEKHPNPKDWAAFSLIGQP